MPDYDVPKAEWGDGPWQHEPDRVEWRSGELPCLLVRGPMGAWCGYVGLPPEHPWRELDQRDVEDVAEVHGGVTYFAPCHGDVCHAPGPGETDDIVWVGFDCSHAFDLMPASDALMRKHGIRDKPNTRDTYRTVDYARAEVEQLAAQAQAARAGR